MHASCARHEWCFKCQVSVSRFFQWPARWHQVSPLWSFWRVILDQWHALKSKEHVKKPDEEDEGNAAQRGRKAHSDLLNDLRNMQKSRHSLDVVRDILHDGQIRIYANMLLGTHVESSPCGSSLQPVSAHSF